jgi:hypothetical protein
MRAAQQKARPGKARKANVFGKRTSSSRIRTPAQQADACRDWAKIIRKSWAKTIAAIVETGKHLSAAKADLPHGEFHNLIYNKVSFGWTTADRLMAIARHPVLANFAAAQSLPASWTTLYELSRLRPKRLLALIKDRTVTPKTERQDAERLVAREIEQTPQITAPTPAPRTVSLTITRITRPIAAIGYLKAQPDNVDDDPPLDSSKPTGNVSDELQAVALQAREIIEPPIDRFEILVAAWEVAGESDRRRFLDHIGARVIH